MATNPRETPISVTKTIYTVTDFLGWQRQGDLNLRPYFQRGDVWTPKAKSFLIDTLLRGYPIPIIYLQNKQDRVSLRNMRQVVDGQQRLRTILAYIDPDSLRDRTDRDDFSILRSHNPEFAGKSFRELPPDAQDWIANTEMSVHVLPSTLTDQHLLQLFARLNSTGERLNDQELRNAEYHGAFKALAYALSYEQIDRWQKWGIFSPRALAQMKDAELMSELIILTMHGIQGKSKVAINNFYGNYDDTFELAEKVRDRITRAFDGLESIFDSPSLRDSSPFKSQSWLYAIFAATDFAISGPPLIDCADGMQLLYANNYTLSDLRTKISRMRDLLETEKIPDRLLKALRGASSDSSSRATRLAFITSA